MEWSKIKNIILAILLTVNLILLGVVDAREYQSAQYDAQTLVSAVTLLASNGITVAADRPHQADGLSILQLESAAQDSQEQRELVSALSTRTGASSVPCQRYTPYSHSSPAMPLLA